MHFSQWMRLAYRERGRKSWAGRWVRTIMYSSYLKIDKWNVVGLKLNIGKRFTLRVANPSMRHLVEQTPCRVAAVGSYPPVDARLNSGLWVWPLSILEIYLLLPSLDRKYSGTCVLIVSLFWDVKCEASQCSRAGKLPVYSLCNRLIYLLAQVLAPFVLALGAFNPPQR